MKPVSCSQVLIEISGYRVVEAISGKEAVEFARREPSSRDLSVEVAIRNNPRTTASGHLELQIQ